MYYEVTISRLYRFPVLWLVSTPIYLLRRMWADDKLSRSFVVKRLGSAVSSWRRSLSCRVRQRTWWRHGSSSSVDWDGDVVVTTVLEWYHIRIPFRTTHLMTSFIGHLILKWTSMNFHSLHHTISSTRLRPSSYVEFSLNCMKGQMCMLHAIFSCEFTT